MLKNFTIVTKLLFHFERSHLPTWSHSYEFSNFTQIISESFSINVAYSRSCDPHESRKPVPWSCLQPRLPHLPSCDSRSSSFFFLILRRRYSSYSKRASEEKETDEPGLRSAGLTLADVTEHCARGNGFPCVRVRAGCVFSREAITHIVATPCARRLRPKFKPLSATFVPL